MRETLLLDVPHRQVVFTIPRMPQIFFKCNRKLFGSLCRCALRSLTLYFKMLASGEPRPGVIARVTFHIPVIYNPKLTSGEYAPWLATGSRSSGEPRGYDPSVAGRGFMPRPRTGSLPPEETAARLDGVLAAAGLPRDELLEGWSGMFSGRASRELREELLAIWADNAGARNPGGYRAMALSMAEADLRDVLPRIQVPTLLLYGELDERSPLKVANALHAGIPRSRLVVIEGAGHLANAEAPEEFNEHVRRFIRTVVRR